MKRPQEIAKERDTMTSIAYLTNIFESLASMKIAQTKDQVLHSQVFFQEIWSIYSQMRIDSLFRFGREKEQTALDRDLFIAITAEGGFSGDIDQKLISYMLEQHDPAKQDIIIIGHHGATQLTQHGVKYKKYYKLPQKDENINVTPLVAEISQYKNTSVFYQAYVSLMVQDIKKIDLQKSVQDAGSQSTGEGDVIDEISYIFEPNSYAVVAHLERTMLKIALSQTILDSKLAQFASRFRSMSASKERANESEHDLKIQYYRAKRAVSDERLKEMINGMRRSAGRV
ncbi:F0F1 ATP synthase subunit gamma [Candidatus Saccharibacteria bacterium]|nr:F0F1 ATP synthase subunit gamma [Candidatus Saccharibacteria bacterium]